MRFPPPPLLLLLLTGLASVQLCAQQVNLSLHPTAVPDSFEVRATATSGIFTYLPNAVFTLRWELSSGGVANNSDVRRPCGVFPVYNYVGTQDVGAYRYFPLILNGERNMDNICPIDTGGTVLCGVRIRELSGCRHIAIVQNAYTGMNNLDYYFSVGGSDVTGTITSAPIAEGDCSGCVPPAIQSMELSPLPECGSGPVDFSVEATGTDMDYSWTSPTGTLIGYGPQGSLATGSLGQYVVTVTNACGWASDTAITGFDPNLCDPAVLDSVWFELLPPDAGQMRLHSAGTGSCPTWRWIIPAGWHMDGDSAVSMALPATPGMYTFILYSPCGNDTLFRELTPEMLCLRPEISLLTSDAPAQLCNLNPYALHVQGSGTPPPLFEWTAPDGSLVGTGDSAWLDPPQEGLYRVRAISSCGTDSAFYPVQLDTAGLAECVPPVILSITVPEACLGDTVVVQAETNEATGPCLNYIWNGIWPSNSPEWVLYGQLDQLNTLYVTNACGNATAEFSSPYSPMNYFQLNICGASDVINLNEYYSEYMVNGGLWLVGDIPTNGIYQPVIDSSITYSYQLPNGCDRLQVNINNYPSHYAGTNASIQICTDSDPVDLFPLLGPNAEPGGSWTYAIGDSFSGIFDPDDFFGTFTIVFRYGVGSDWTCWDTAFVTVTETPGPFPWYADADGDGLGDPLDSLLSCDSIPGYVTVAGDACPTVPGTIGSPCDDGLAWTLNDTLDTNCLCMGIPTAVVEQDDARWRLWPNPAKDQVYLQAPPLGAVSITVLDVRGRVVQVLERHLGNGPVNWPTSGLARGSYAVRILSPHAVRVMRLVVQ